MTLTICYGEATAKDVACRRRSGVQAILDAGAAPTERQPVEGCVCGRARRVVWPSVAVVRALALLHHRLLEPADAIGRCPHLLLLELTQCAIIDHFSAEDVGATLLALDVLVHRAEVGVSLAHVVHPVVARLLQVPTNELLLVNMSQSLELLRHCVLRLSKQVAGCPVAGRIVNVVAWAFGRSG